MYLSPGLITSAVDIAGLFSSFLISYLGNRGHKTRWVASGTLLVGLSCFMRLVPHLIFGPGQDALELTEEYGTSHHTAVGNFSSINGKSCMKVYFVGTYIHNLLFSLWQVLHVDNTGQCTVLVIHRSEMTSITTSSTTTPISNLIFPFFLHHYQDDLKIITFSSPQ